MAIKSKVRAVWLLVFFHCGWSILWAADNVETIKERINAIKMDPAYIGAESTQTDEGVAYYEAICLVQYFFNQTQKDQGQDTLSFDEIHLRIRSLSHPRGEKHRVFAFAKIMDLEQMLSAKASSVPAHDECASPKSFEKEVSAHEQSMVDTADKEIEPQEFTSDKAQFVQESPVSVAAQTTSGIVDVILSLQQVEMIEDAKLVLKQFMQEGKIEEFNKLNSLSDIKDGRFLLMYEKNGIVRALLEVQQSSFRNIKTNQIETSQQYRGCSAYWFR